MSSDDRVLIAHHPSVAGFVVIHLMGDESPNPARMEYLDSYADPSGAIATAEAMHTEYGITFTRGVLDDIHNTYRALANFEAKYGIMESVNMVNQDDDTES